MPNAVRMRRDTAQPVWPSQRYFRVSLQGLAESALAGIGAAVAPECFIVGLPRPGEAPGPVRVEPENGPFAQADLLGVEARAWELYEDHPERHSIDAHPGQHAHRQAGLHDEARGRALCDALAASPTGAGRTFFAGDGVPVGEHVVYPVVSVLTARWSALPALSTTERDDVAVHQSLQLAVVRQVLRAATRVLRQQPPPPTIGEEPADIIRSAADRLVDSVTQGLLRQFLGTGLKESLDAVAAQPYEGRAGAGTVLLTAPDHPHAEAIVSFDRPVPVRATRELRKVLEMSASDLGLLCDGEHVRGMGRLTAAYDPRAEDAFVATVVGRGSWELALPAGENNGAGVPLLRVDNGRATLPKARLSKDKFLDTVARLFPQAPDGSADRLWDLAQTCAEQAHGTMLVVHQQAADEGQRLQPQALTIAPTHPSQEALLAMTSIDGAVLVGPDARCHAVGVILDGTATGTGDPARGARYNSAVRYLAGHGQGALIIIVSEDGMMNLLPDLRARRRREDAPRAVERLVAASEGTPDYEQFYGLVRHVASLEFYLDQAQCDAVNAAQQAVSDRRWNRSGQRVAYRQMKPDPNMDDTHWL